MEPLPHRLALVAERARRALVRRLEGDQRRRGGEEPRVVRRAGRPARRRRRQGRRLRAARGARPRGKVRLRARLRRGARTHRARRSRRPASPSSASTTSPAAVARGRGGRAPGRHRAARARRARASTCSRTTRRAGAPSAPRWRRCAMTRCRDRSRCRARAAARCSAGRSRGSASARSCAPRRPTPGSCSRSPALVGLGIVMVFNVSYFLGQRATSAIRSHFFRKHLVVDRARHGALRASPSRVPLGRATAGSRIPLLVVVVAGAGARARPGHRRRAQRRAALARARAAHLPADRARQVRARALPGALARRKGERVRELRARRRCRTAWWSALLAALLPARARLRHRGARRRRCWSLMLFAGGVRARATSALLAARGRRPALVRDRVHAPYRLKRVIGVPAIRDADPLGDRLPARAVVHRLRLGRRVGRRARREPAEDVLPAGGAHRLHLLGDRRGARPARRARRARRSSRVVALRGFRIARRAPRPRSGACSPSA